MIPGIRKSNVINIGSRFDRADLFTRVQGIPLFSRASPLGYGLIEGQRTRMRRAKIPGMKQWMKDTAGLGIVFWLMGYLASLVLFFTPYAGIMGWILAAIFTPVALVVTWWWFRSREYLPVQYYAGVGVVWVLIAMVFDFLFIVTLFQAAAYYKPDVIVYYIVTFLVPVAVGLYLNRSPGEPLPKAG